MGGKRGKGRGQPPKYVGLVPPLLYPVTTAVARVTRASVSRVSQRVVNVFRQRNITSPPRYRPTHRHSEPALIRPCPRSPVRARRLYRSPCLVSRAVYTDSGEGAGTILVPLSFSGLRRFVEEAYTSCRGVRRVVCRLG